MHPLVMAYDGAANLIYYLQERPTIIALYTVFICTSPMADLVDVNTVPVQQTAVSPALTFG